MSNLAVTEFVSGGAVTAENLNAFVKNASPTKDFINGLNGVNTEDVSDLKVMVSTGSSSNSGAAKATAYEFLTLFQNSLNTTTATGGVSLQSANLALGYSAGISGIANISVGPQAAQNSSGEANVYVGSRAGQNASSGDRNVGLGVESLRGISASNKNTAIGFMSLTGSAGNENVAVGDSAGKGVSGSQNIAIGSSALQGSSSGNDNVAIGTSALSHNQLTLGQRNVAVGTNSLKSLQGHGDNVAIGDNTLESGMDIQHTVAVGSGAGRNNSGVDNVFVGYQAGNAASSASNSVIIGSGASAPFNHCIVIGTGASATKVNQVVIGSSNTASVRILGVPNSDSGLIQGELYHDNGALKIVL